MIKAGYVRVSEILGQWKRYDGINPVILQNKANLGTAVHESIAAHQDDIHLQVPEEAKGYFDSYLLWHDTVKPKLQSLGRLYCDKLMITGEVDSLVQMPHSEEWAIIDWKTCAQSDETIWKLQGQFYHYLCSSNSIEISKSFYFVQLMKDGKMPKVREYKSSSPLLNVCMSAYICHRYLNGVDQKTVDQSKCSL